MIRLILIFALILFTFQGLNTPAIAQSQHDNREALLEELRGLLPYSEEWELWLEESGELPPDFDEMERIPFLPDPLRMQNGELIETAEDWPHRREELLYLFKHYIIGQYPEAPGNVRVRKKRTTEESHVTIHEIILEFGPGHKAMLSIELILPKGEGPFPVFITQDNHRRWALIAVSRGYAGVVYAGSDSKDDTEDWIPIYPKYDWTRLTRRAWAAGRVIDYIETLDFIDNDRIALTGHSRNGKLAIIGGAIDQRIDAVISSSSGAAGVLSFRSFSEVEFGESIEVISRNYPSWVHPRLRFFAGREDRLPIDSPNLITTIAPRPFLFAHALNDQYESSVWDLEHSYRSAGKVYQLLNATENINLLYRAGTHETRAEDIEQYIDWLDYHFDRGFRPHSSLLVYPVTEDWRKSSTDIPNPEDYPARGLGDLLNSADGSAITTADDWIKKLPDIRERIGHGLGSPPPETTGYPGRYGTEPLYMSHMLMRATLPDGVVRYSLNFGNYINGDLYVPEITLQDQVKIPVIIWIHPVSVARGYSETYRRGPPAYLALVNDGYAVFTFDMIGHGARLQEATRFYERYPGWTLLGKMVHDVRQAVNALTLESRTEHDDFGDITFIDHEQIYVFGYAMGGKVALHAAALDERIAGAVSIAGFSPMRLDNNDKLTGGLARWSEHFPLQPWLSGFIGYETNIPYDYHEVLAAIAPRKVAVVTPEIDRYANPEDVVAAVNEAAKIFELLGVRDHLQMKIPHDYNRLGPEMLKTAFSELRDLINHSADH